MKILLVDDERIALTALVRKLNDTGLECNITGCAGSGMEALHMMEEDCPDVLITDIRMPVMDGLELIKCVNERFPSVISVILTGYSEFEYAKKAIKMGVNEYLLKPVDINELKTCLLACSEQLNRRYKQRNAISFMVDEQEMFLRPQPHGQSYVLLYLICGNPLHNFENIIHPAVALPSPAWFEKFLAAMIKPTGSVQCFNGVFSNELLVILSLDDSDMRTIEALLEKAAINLSERFRIYVTFQLEKNISAETLTRSVRTSRQKAVDSVILGCTQLCANKAPSARPIQSSQNVPLLSTLLIHRDYDLFSVNFARLLKKWHIDRQPLTEVQRNLVYLMQSILNRCDITLSVSSLDYLAENTMSFSSSEEQLIRNFCQLMMELASDKGDFDDRTGELLVEKIEAFLVTNIAETLTLQMLCARFGVSKAYLCRVFKKHKNATPIAYFTQLKIERAKEFLVQFPKAPISQIAEQLGFNDVYYFSKVFKKYVGEPPAAFRSQEEAEQ